MKSLKIIKMSLLSLSILASSGMFGMINLNEVLKQAKDFAGQISISSDPMQTAESVKNVAAKVLNNLPETIFGVNIEQLKKGQIPAVFLPKIQFAIEEANKYLPKLIALLNFPDQTLGLLKLAYPYLQDILGDDPFGKQALNAFKAALDFANNNPGAVKELSKRLASTLKPLQEVLAQLKDKDLTRDQLAQIFSSSSVSKLIDHFQDQYEELYPVVIAFVDAHRDAIRNIINQIIAIDLTIDIQQLIQKAQYELKKLGVGF